MYEKLSTSMCLLASVLLPGTTHSELLESTIHLALTTIYWLPAYVLYDD